MKVNSAMINSFLKDLPDDSMSPVERRFKMKSFKSFFPIFKEFESQSDKQILKEDKEFVEKFIYVEYRYEALNAGVSIGMEFSKDLNLENMLPEYLFILQEFKGQKLIYNYEEEVICQYGGYHWTNLLGLLYTLLTSGSPKSDDFVINAEKYRTGTEASIDWSTSTSDDSIKITKAFTVFIKTLFKDPHRFIIRYLIFNKEEVVKRSGIEYLLPAFTEFMKSSKSQTILDSFNDIFFEALNSATLVDEIKDPSEIAHPPSNIKLPMDRPSLTEKIEEVIDKGVNLGGGICCYKLTYDTTPDRIRMIESESPYVNSAIYDPPIKRDVKLVDQPFRFQLVNCDIDMTDLDGDTSNMRKIVVSDQLTKALDWASKKGLPLPKYGTEFYIHLADGASPSISNQKLMLAVYSRKRGDSNFLYPFPDYSYQVFSTTSRFHIRNSKSMTWNHIRDHIISEKSRLQVPVKDKEPKIFFRGNEFDHISLRKKLFHLQKYDIKMGRSIIMKKDSMKIEIPKLEVGKELPPMSINDMGKYKILLDLPGYGMWSTRLKFISLTGSYVIRVMFLEHTYDKKTNIWTAPDSKKDLWETFTDTFLPIEFTHTVIGDYYKGFFIPDSEAYKYSTEMNNNSRLRVIKEIGDIYKNINAPQFQKMPNKLFTRVSSLTEDHISEYIYRMIMMQSEYYGFSETT